MASHLMHALDDSGVGRGAPSRVDVVTLSTYYTTMTQFKLCTHFLADAHNL